MIDLFFAYTNQFVRFTPADKALLEATLTLKTAENKTVLVEHGKRTDELYFLLKGCIRKYYIKDGEQITIYITTESNFIGAFEGFITGNPAKESIECIEPCEFLVLKKADLERLYKEIPQMNEFIRKVLERSLIQFQHATLLFILDSPEERYLKMLAQNPEVLQRVPQHMLATYLGITATSLSRIRKRIVEHK